MDVHIDFKLKGEEHRVCKHKQSVYSLNQVSRQ